MGHKLLTSELVTTMTWSHTGLAVLALLAKCALEGSLAMNTNNNEYRDVGVPLAPAGLVAGHFFWTRMTRDPRSKIHDPRDPPSATRQLKNNTKSLFYRQNAMNSQHKWSHDERLVVLLPTKYCIKPEQKWNSKLQSRTVKIDYKSTNFSNM